MKNIITIFLLTLLTSSLYAYTDYDIDGVDDNVDLCPNTPFDALADANGCSKDQHKNTYIGKLTLKFGSDIGVDDSQTDTTYNYFLGYRYDRWSLSLSSSNYIDYESQSQDNENGDLYITSGYLFKQKNYNAKISLGVKLATADDRVGTGEEDYYSSIFFDYFVGIDKDLFVYYGYTLSGDSDDVDYKNFSTISIGFGKAITNKYYSSISYDFSGSNYDGIDDYRAISWYNSYNFTKNIFASISYSYGLDDLSYEHTFSLKIGVNFE